MTTLIEGRHAGEFLLSEANFHRSRDNVTIAFSQTIKPGGVLARKAVAASVVVSAAADAGNTGGSGALTPADPAVSSKVKDGIYQIVCIEPASNAGTFEVFDPSGKSIGKATVGVAFNKEIKFTIADATDFVAGDRFTFTVKADAEDFQFVAFNQDGTDGSEVPAAIAIHGVVTPADATAKIAVISRDAEVNGRQLEWPADIDSAETADAIQALAGLGIIVRT